MGRVVSSLKMCEQTIPGNNGGGVGVGQLLNGILQRHIMCSTTSGSECGMVREMKAGELGRRWFWGWTWSGLE